MAGYAMTASENRDPLRALVSLFWVHAMTGVLTLTLAVATNVRSLPENARHLGVVVFPLLLRVLVVLSVAFLVLSVRRRAALSGLRSSLALAWWEPELR